MKKGGLPLGGVRSRTWTLPANLTNGPVLALGKGMAYAYLQDRLVQAFSVALQHDATAVLERGASGLPVGAVCGYDPFFGAETPPTSGEFQRAVAARERLVAGVKRADVSAARDSCLAALRQLRAAGAARYAP